MPQEYPQEIIINAQRFGFKAANTISRIKIDLFNLNREGAQPTF